MSFLSALQQKNLDYVLGEHEFQPIVPQNGDKFADLLVRIVKEQLDVYIDYDCDPDGYFSGLALVDTLRLVGYTKYTLVKHEHKRHVLDEAYVASLARSQHKVIFILDSSTNDMASITTLTEYGKTVCVVDHHEPKYQFGNYPAGAIVVNPCIDNTYTPVCYNCLSCGAVVSLLCAYALQTRFRIKPPQSLFLYGVVTLYSDIMDMSNAYNISFVSRYRNAQIIDSPLIRLFWDDKYDHFDKSYISFKLIPRLNALFRTESFDLLYTLFFDHSEIDYSQISKQIDMHYQECKKYTQKLLDECNLIEYPNFVLAKLKDDSGGYAQNFTGLVANNLSSRFNKAVICLYATTPVAWQGSVRDPFSRDLLSLMRPVCYAEGHSSAFGIKVDARDLDMTITTLREIMSGLKGITDTVILTNWDDRDNLGAEMQQMAEFNEFGGQGLPMAMGAITVKPSFKIYRNERKISVYGEGQVYLCFVPTVEVGDVLLVKPALSGAGYTNFVNNVHLR